MEPALAVFVSLVMVVCLGALCGAWAERLLTRLGLIVVLLLTLLCVIILLALKFEAIIR